MFNLDISDGSFRTMFSFLFIMQKITYVALKNKKFIFNCYYEDGNEDMLERGEYFSSILDVPFNFIKIT